jgi:hypothetical protein
MPTAKPPDLAQFCEVLFSGHRVPANPPTVSPADHDKISAKWRKAFATQLHRATGEWCIGGFDWHVFTYGHAEAITKQAAIDRYILLGRKEGYVFTHTIKHPLCCLISPIPTYEGIKHALRQYPQLTDLYIVAFDFQWTFVVTHETSSGLGPFFSVNPHFTGN